MPEEEKLLIITEELFQIMEMAISGERAARNGNNAEVAANFKKIHDKVKSLIPFNILEEN